MFDFDETASNVPNHVRDKSEDDNEDQRLLESLEKRFKKLEATNDHKEDSYPNRDLL